MRVTRQAPIQLGWSQFAVVYAGLMGILAVLWVISPYDWQELYYREFAIPRLQTKYGFRCGHVKAVRSGTTYFEGAGIVSVDLDGEFARMGVRPGDAPFEYHGGGFTTMYDALETAARGGFAAFDVVNAYDSSAGMDGFRTIPVYPRVREMPVPLRRDQLRSPAGPLTIIVFESNLDRRDRELWVWDPVSGSRRRLYAFREFVKATWSGDGNWLAVIDEELLHPSRCAVIDVNRGRAQDLTDVLMRMPPPVRPASSDRLECEIFGWVLDNRARVAVIFRNLGAAPRQQWIYNFFFDVTTGQLLAAVPR